MKFHSGSTIICPAVFMQPYFPLDFITASLLIRQEVIKLKNRSEISSFACISMLNGFIERL
jgi:hypothetical protein